MGLYTIIWMLVAGLVLASLGWLAYRQLTHRLLQLEAILPGVLRAAAEPRASSRVWLHLVGPVLLGALLTSALNVAGCNTTPTQSRVGKLEDQMHDVQTFMGELHHQYVPRDEMETKTAAVDKIQAQRDKRIDDLEARDAQILGYLLQRGDSHGQ